MNSVVAAILAHPDDAEFLCAGVLIRLAQDHDWTVHIASMTAGDCGSAEHTSVEISRIRQGEAAAAAAIIGAQYHCLHERDLRVFYNNDTLTKVTRYIREVRPDVILTHNPRDYHLDHEMTSQVVRAAAFAAPVPLFEAGSAAIDHIPHLYYCDALEGKDLLGRDVAPSLRIDISAVIEKKTAMLACHASQRNWLLKHHGIDEYLSAMQRWSAHRGSERGVPFAEGFQQHLGHSFPQDDILGRLLAQRGPRNN